MPMVSRRGGVRCSQGLHICWSCSYLHNSYHGAAPFAGSGHASSALPKLGPPLTGPGPCYPRLLCRALGISKNFVKDGGRSRRRKQARQRHAAQGSGGPAEVPSRRLALAVRAPAATRRRHTCWQGASRCARVVLAAGCTSGWGFEIVSGPGLAGSCGQGANFFISAFMLPHPAHALFHHLTYRSSAGSRWGGASAKDLMATHPHPAAAAAACFRALASNWAPGQGTGAEGGPARDTSCRERAAAWGSACCTS